MLTRRIVATLTLLLAAGYATAQPGPQLLTVFPNGAKAGETVEVTLAGHAFDGNEKLLFNQKGFKVESAGAVTAPKPQAGQPTAFVKFKVTVPKDANLGTCDVRLVSKSGLSNPRAFVISGMDEANETEPNNDVPQAQKIELNTSVNGVISTPTDVDYVTFKAKKGDNVVVYCLTTSLDSKMQADLMVSGPDGKQLASNRNYRGGDAVLDFKAPADGDYLVRLSQFAYTTGNYEHFYRLTVTTLGPWADAMFPPLCPASNYITVYGRNFPPGKEDERFLRPDGRPFGTITTIAKPEASIREGVFATRRLVTPVSAMIDAMDLVSDEPLGHLMLHSRNPVILDNEKNNTADTAQEVKVPCDLAGRVAKKNERHWYSFEAKKGEVWTLEVFAERIGSPVDAFFILTDDKGKVITEQDDGADPLSPNQFYTKGDDPARYRFLVPNDGTYKVMVSTRESGVQFGVRDQYVLRIAKENPDFRLAVMPFSPHLPDAGTLPKGGSVLFTVFVFRFDGFNDEIELSADKLPEGVKCPPQVIGPGQTRGTLVLTAEKDIEDWEGFVTIKGKSGKLEYTARPFTVTWSPVGIQAVQPPPNSPMITRMDRGPGLALAIRGEALFTLTPTEEEVKVKPGGRAEVTLKITRDAKYKDAIAIISATPNMGPRPQGNQPFPPVGTAQPASSEIKVNIDIPANLPPGTHTLVLRGQSAAPPPKGGNVPVRPAATFPTVPITVIVEGAPKKK